MIFINPQWQGSGFTDELKVGASTFKTYFKGFEITEIPLSDKDLATVENIKCFQPLLEQTTTFKNIIASRTHKKISTLGGDCGIEIIPISYLNKIYQGDICVVWIDAHPDLSTPETSQSKTLHAMPLRLLLGEGNNQFKELLFSIIKPVQICMVGLRAIDDDESEYILNNKITSLSGCEFGDIQDKVKNFKNVYIHLDLDVLDKSEFEFTLSPTRNGFSVTAVAELIKKLKESNNVVGFCITESTATNLEQLNKIKPILDQIEL